MLIPMNRTLLVSLFCLITLPSSAIDILHVGNSYTSYNGQNKSGLVLQSLLSEEPSVWLDPLVFFATKGGYTFQQHALDANQTGQALESYLNPSTAQKLDLVILQEQSQTPGFYVVNDPLWLNSLAGASELNSKIESIDANTWFLMTWGRRLGDSSNSFLYPDFLSMQDCLKEGYLAYQTQLSTPERPVYVAPAGLAWKAVYDTLVKSGAEPLEAESLFTKLYTGDNSHPSAYGSYLTGLVLYASITGRSVHATEFIPTAIAAEDALLLKNAASSIVFSLPPSTVSIPGSTFYPYPWIKPWSQISEDISESTLTLGENGMRPMIILEEPTPPLITLSIGTSGDANEWDAQLLILDGGVLDVGTLILAGNQSEIHIHGGTIKVENFQGNLTQKDGIWTLPSTNCALQGDYEQKSEATLEVTLIPASNSGETSLLHVSGDATISGTLSLKTSVPKEGLRVLEANTITTSGLVVTGISGEDLTWELLSLSEEKEALFVSSDQEGQDSDASTGTPDVVDPEDSTDEEDGEDPEDSQLPEEEDSESALPLDTESNPEDIQDNNDENSSHMDTDLLHSEDTSTPMNQNDTVSNLSEDSGFSVPISLSPKNQNEGCGQTDPSSFPARGLWWTALALILLWKRQEAMG